MRMKKYTGRTEQEAIEKVKEELGLDALILNIRKVQPKGIFAFFKKPQVEVTAAYTEKSMKAKLALEADEKKETEKEEGYIAALAGQKPMDFNPMESQLKEQTITEQQEAIKELENKLSSAEELLEAAMSRLRLSTYKTGVAGTRKYDNHMIQLFYDTLVEQGVLPEIAEKILELADSIDEADKIDINLIVKIVYNGIINILGAPEPLPPTKKRGKARVVVFIGPTGVGKTTTIAKLSAVFILNHHLKVGLVTSDTYRIAAVDQLRTYADILGINVGVVYNAEDLQDTVMRMSKMHDLILLDTAGRSHKNKDNLAELKELLDSLPKSERFLVLSTTTRYEDLISIVQAYAAFSDFKIIFTKLDETSSLGSILNICYITGRKISYVTTGQNVPEDIETAKPEKVAKALLGLESGVF